MNYSNEHKVLSSPNVHTQALNSACNDENNEMRRKWGEYLQLMVHWKALDED